MKYEKLTISGIPKKFDVWDLCNYIQPITEDMDLEDILYDALPDECDEDKGEDAVVIFKYYESATGVRIIHTPHLQILSLWLSPWAVETDVRLYAALIGAILAKHKKAKLYDKYAPLKGLTEDDIRYMISERKKYIKRLMTTKDEFTMKGIHAEYILTNDPSYITHLPANLIDSKITALQDIFVKLQWIENEEEEEEEEEE